MSERGLTTAELAAVAAELRLALGLARSFASSTRFILDQTLAAAMFLRARYLLELARAEHPQVASGVFGAEMQVELVNDGPVTFWLES